MLFIGSSGEIDSKRGIVWHRGDSFALRAFLGHSATEATPVHVSMSIIRKRRHPEVFSEVSRPILGMLQEHRLLRPRTIGMVATTLNANAYMLTMMRRNNADDWNQHLWTRRIGSQSQGRGDVQRGLAKPEEFGQPNGRDERRRTDLSYEAQHPVGLDTEAIDSPRLRPRRVVVLADRADVSARGIFETFPVLRRRSCDRFASTPLRSPVSLDSSTHRNPMSVLVRP